MGSNMRKISLGSANAAPRGQGEKGFSRAYPTTSTLLDQYRAPARAHAKGRGWPIDLGESIRLLLSRARDQPP